MPKNLSAKYYQENKEILLKEADEIYQILSNEQKGKKSDIMLVNITKISEKMKKKAH